MLPILLQFGPLNIYTYGAMIALGGGLGFWFLHSRSKSMGFSKDEHYWLFVNLVLLCGAIGGRILHLIEYVPFSSPDFWAQAFSFKTGFSVLGAYLGAGLGTFFLCRRLGLGFLRVWDHFSMILPLWHFFGRLGCLGAGCCFGRPADVPWAVVYASVPGTLVDPELLGVPLHPTQLYEALPELLLVPVLFFALFRPMERGAVKPGYLSAAYTALYCVIRFFNEFYRADAVPLAGLGISAAQALCLAYVAAAVSLIAWLRSRPDVPGHP
ncbi:MAG: prolipoprotein diacylglyceryl transferase [Elusimicrobia bacterium]|nr:prolipoprotein diacylglyceryl transferase [Elusimicrobiota bacterium]